MKRSFIYILLLVSLFFVASSCKDAVVGTFIEPPKSPLEMKWTIDTIAYEESFQTIMTEILAFSSTDLFIYGHNSTYRGKVYYFNGETWAEQDLSPYIPTYNVYEFISFGRDNIWGFGWESIARGGIYRYDKSGWYKYEKDKWKIKRFLNVAASDENNIWSGGDDGIIYHKQNLTWLRDSIDVHFPNPTSYLLKDVVIYNGKPFVMARINDTNKHRDNTYFVTGDIKNWTIVDSMILGPPNNYTRNGGDYKLYVSPTNKLFSYGSGGIWERVNDKWVNVLKLDFGIGGFRGISDYYTFAVGDYGYVAWFNGNGWIQLKQFQTEKQILYRDVWTDGKEVFIVGYDASKYPMKSIVLHGK